MKEPALSAGNRGVLRMGILVALRSLYLDPVDPPALIPEPATALLLGAGIAALACAGRCSLTNTFV